MKKIEKIVKQIEEGLIDFSPVVIEYGKDMVVGFPNESNSSDLIIFVKEDDIVMTFGFQNAHFAVDDITSCIEHTKKYLNSEYASVEFFVGDKDLFGGSRLSSTVDFSSVDKIVDCYALDNQVARDGLYKFFKENKDVVVRAVTYDNTINKVANIYYDGENFKVLETR
jgi:hypothetical protein